MQLGPGTIVADYRIVRALGAGGMGNVYLAAHPTLPRNVALKILSAELSTDSAFRARFTQEADMTSRLDHPNIVTVFDRGEDNGRLWIAMQYVAGTDANDELRMGPSIMPPHRALRIVDEISRGLDYAHRRGLLHRDVKPANFLLAPAEGDDERVLLTDFGVAKALTDERGLTETGKVLATFAFAAPEQLTGAPLDHRVDVYSLGCSLYELLTGQHPYPSPMPAVVIMGHLQQRPPQPSATRPGLPRALDDVVAQALAKDPAQRFGSCRELSAAALAAFDRTSPPQFRSHVATTPRANLASPLLQRKRRNRLLAGAAGVLAMVTAVVVGVMMLRDDSPADGVSTADIRAEHPEFDGKTITAVNMADDGGYSIVLHPSPQSNFLEDIGFRYSPTYRAEDGESSPRPVSAQDLAVDSEIVVVVRTDVDAANGGLRGIPQQLLTGATLLAVLDDPADTTAFQEWSAGSAADLTGNLVPLLAETIN